MIPAKCFRISNTSREERIEINEQVADLVEFGVDSKKAALKVVGDLIAEAEKEKSNIIEFIRKNQPKEKPKQKNIKKVPEAAAQVKTFPAIVEEKKAEKEIIQVKPSVKEKAVDKKKEQYSVKTTFKDSNLSLKDVQSLFKGQKVGKAPDGTIFVRTALGRGVQIKSVDTISPDEAAFKVGYSRMKASGELVAGKYLDGAITISKVGDKWTLAHESEHWMEDTGLINKNDQKALSGEIKRRIKKGTWKTLNPDDIGGKEDRAEFIAQELKKRSDSRPTVQRVIQKIQDLIDSLVNLYKRTAKGVVKSVESGEIFNKAGEPAPITPEIKQKALREGMPLFMVKGFHGSPHSFDKFTTEKIGTGEGAQAFGWGLYFTDKETIAKSYARPRTTYLKERYGDIWDGVYHAIHKNKTEGIRRIQEYIDYIKSIPAGPRRTLTQPQKEAIKKAEKTLTDVRADKIKPRNLYKVTLHKGKKPGEYEWLEWEQTLSADTLSKIKTQLNKEKNVSPKAIAYIKTQLGEKISLKEYASIYGAEENPEQYRGEWEAYNSGRKDWVASSEGMEFYQTLSGQLGSDKEASLFLLRAGIDGIKYPTGTLSGVKGSDKFNYVVFDESVVDIEKHEQYSVKKPDLDPDIKELLNKYMPEAKESLEKLKEPTQKKINKEANGLFKYAQERFGKKFVDKDMKFYDRAFGVPYWLGKKFKSMAVAVGIEIDAAEKRSTELFNDYEGALGELQDGFRKWSKAKKKEFTDLIWKWDGQRMPEKDVPTDWHKEIVAGEDIEINPEHYEEVRAYLTKQGGSPKAVDGFITIRKKLDEKYVDIDNVMRVEQLDPALITEYRAEIKKVNNYFPHRRTGNAYIQIFDKEKGNVVFREHYNIFKDRVWPANRKATARAEKWLREAIKKGDLEGQVSDYRIGKPGPMKELPDEVFFQIPIEGIQQVVARAGKSLSTSRVQYEADRLYNKEGHTKKEALELARKRLSADMEVALSKAVSDTFKARGWGKHGIHRKNIPGHETDDVFGILFDYLSGYSGFKTKIERTKAHHKNLIELDAGKNPNEYKHLSKYVKDMLANQDRTDRTVDTLRGIFFVKYLGFVVKSGMVNLTQNVVMAAPMLGLHTKGASRKLARAMVDTRKALTAKNAWFGKEVKYKHLTKGEQQALHDMIESGASMDLFLRELKGNMPGVGIGKHFKKVIDKSGIFMQVAEKFNRASTGLAAYRVGIKEKNMTHDEAVELAKQVIYDSHFLYGKANMPTGMRGGDAQKIARAAYTFRSFSHNYILAMKHLAFNQPGGKKAFFRSLRNLFLMGGLTSIPFFKVLSEAFLWAFGEDDEDALTKIRGYMPNEWTKDLVVYGLPGILGADFSGSLSIEVPRNYKDIIGVPYAAVEDSINMYKSLKSGNVYRAASETPVTPISVRNAMRGLELYTVGHRTRSGRDINAAGKVGPRKITGKEFVQKSLIGLQPTSVSKGFASYRATKKMQTAISEKRRSFADRFVNAFKRGDKEGWQAVLREVAKWNATAAKEGKPHRKINIRGMIESRMKPGFNNIPKSMRYKALQIQKEWE